MNYIATTTSPAIAQQIINANPGAYSQPGQNGQIHIYTNGPIRQPNPKQKQKFTQKTKPQYTTDGMPWWLLAIAALLII